MRLSTTFHGISRKPKSPEHLAVFLPLERSYEFGAGH